MRPKSHPLVHGLLLLSIALTATPWSSDEAKAVVKPSSLPTRSASVARAILRLEGAVAHVKINRREDRIAFTDPSGFNLRVLEMKTGAVYAVTPHFVGPSFFWSPDGFRVVYREMLANDGGAATSRIASFDVSQRQTALIETITGPTGYLTFDPRDMRLQLLHDKGILSRKLVFPEERLARWQMSQRTERGKYLASPRAMLWTTQGGLSMARLGKDDDDILSYSLSPDGNAATWATASGKVYVSLDGGAPRLLGDGRDPVWHPEKSLVVYAAARRIGSKIVDYDLKLVNAKGKGRYLTRTPASKERWPVWIKDGQAVMFTLEKSTDIYRLDLPQ